MGNFVQLVIWLGTIVGEENIDEFEKFFKNELGFNVKYEKEFNLKESNHSCVLFYMDSDDIPKFSIFRIQTSDMKWFEDFVDNCPEEIPEEIYKEYGEYLK